MSHPLRRRARRALPLLALAALAPLLAGCQVDEGVPAGFNASVGAEINDNGVMTGWGPTWYGIRGFIKPSGGEYQVLPTIGDASVLPEAINDSNVVVGMLWIKYIDVTVRHPFRWHPTEGITDLGNFGGVNGEAADVNDAGVIVGWSDTAAPDGTNGSMQAWVWEPATKVKQPLPTLNGWPSFAAGINNRGDIAGWVYPSPGVPRAVVWKAGTREIVDLGTDGIPSEAHDINDKGVSSGWVRENSLLQRAGSWPGFSPTFVPIGSSQADSFGSANVINDAGVMVGSGYVGNEQHAFRYDPATKVTTDLGTLEGHAASHAAGLNQHGVAVGWSSDPNGVNRMVRWTVDPPSPTTTTTAPTTTTKAPATTKAPTTTTKAAPTTTKAPATTKAPTS